MQPSKTFSEWMTEQGLDDDEIAIKLRVHRSTISRLRRGKQRPSFDLLRALIEMADGALSPSSFEMSAARSDGAADQSAA